MTNQINKNTEQRAEKEFKIPEGVIVYPEPGLFDPVFYEHAHRCAKSARGYITDRTVGDILPNLPGLVISAGGKYKLGQVVKWSDIEKPKVSKRGFEIKFSDIPADYPSFCPIDEFLVEDNNHIHYSRIHFMPLERIVQKLSGWVFELEEARREASKRLFETEEPC